MTTLSVCLVPAPPTSFERVLLWLSSRLASFATERARRRAAAARSRVVSSATEMRRDAAALAHSGILPR